MLRIQPIGCAPGHNPYRAMSAPGCRTWAPDWNALTETKALRPRPPSVSPHPLGPGSHGPSMQFTDLEVLAALSDFWPGRAPLEHLSTALTPENALLQRNVLLQTGMNSEHFGILVVFQRFAAKAASLPAVLGAVLMSAEYAQHVARQRELMGLPAQGGAVNLTA